MTWIHPDPPAPEPDPIPDADIVFCCVCCDRLPAHDALACDQCGGEMHAICAGSDPEICDDCEHDAGVS